MQNFYTQVRNRTVNPRPLDIEDLDIQSRPVSRPAAKTDGNQSRIVAKEKKKMVETME